MTTPQFSGETFEGGRDQQRLSVQYHQVFAVMTDGQWRTLNDLAGIVGAPAPSISARLRDMRKRRFGGHIVQREHVRCGLFRYRLIENTCPDLV